jgi:hypothetical protein
MPSKLSGSILLGLALACAACKSSSPRVQPPQPRLGEGQVSFQLIDEVEATTPSLEAGQEYSSAYPLPDNPLPIYPAALLPQALPRQEIVVRVIIDGEGNVARFEESPVPSKADPAHREDFVRAVQETVRAWQFHPARIRGFGPGPDYDADGEPDFAVLVTDATLTSYHDVRFFFEVKNGRGVVTAD